MTNAQTEARAIAQTSLWVPAKPEHAKIGWTYDFEQTERIARAAYDSTGYDAVMEVVEFVMAEADRRHATALAAKDAELAAVRADRDEWKVWAKQHHSDLRRAEAQLAEARKALEWHPIETAPLNTIVDLWCTYADAPASWGNDRPAGQIVHNRHKSKEHGWFGNESNDGIPQANGPDLVPVAWRWPAPEIPLEMMERFVAARRALEAHGGKNVA